MTAANPHLKPILIAGVLAAVAVALGMLTLSRQHVDTSSAAAPPAVVRHRPAAPKPVAKPKPAAKPKPLAKPKPAAKPKPLAKPKAQPSPWTKAALAADLPKAVAAQFADDPVVVVTVYSSQSQVDATAQAEAEAGASLAAAGYAAVDVTREGASGAMTKVFGVLPLPTSLVLVRPDFTKPYVKLNGFVDRETIAQAARNAAPAPTAAETQSPWAKAADALCTRTADAFAALPAADTRAELKTKTPKVKALAASFVADLRRLKPPAADAADAARYVSLAERDLQLTVTMAEATAKQDLVTMATASAEEATVAKEADALATDLGAPACASPF